MLSHTPILIIAIPLLSGFIIPLLGKISKRLLRGVVFTSVFINLGFISWLATGMLGTDPTVYTLGAKSPSLALPSGYSVPVRIVLQIDNLSILMSMTVGVIAVAGTLYSMSFLQDRSGETKYYSLLFILFAGMFGMVFTGDAFNMFVFLEVTSVAACGLIGFDITRGRSQEAAFKTLALYTVGALLFLFAVGLMYAQYNALNFAYLAQQINYGFLDKIALTLFLVSLTMKVGAVPMHMWVPDAYGEAPSSISIILVSNTLVSLYALFRIVFTVFGISISGITAGWFLITLGVLSIFIGVSMAFLQDRLKRLMGYCALSQVGYMLLGVGVGIATMNNQAAFQAYGLTALQGGIFHLVNDALYMGLLFLSAGAVIYRTGARTMNDMSGLARSMKTTSIYTLIGIGAIAGIPPLNGFASKLMLYESTFQFNPLLSVIAIIASIMTLAVLAKAFYSSFLGPKLEGSETHDRIPMTMSVGMVLLCILIIFIGLFPNLVVDNVVEPAARSLINQSQYIDAVMATAGGV